MKLTEKDVRYVAGLAHLSLTDAEIAAMVHDLSAVLDHMDQLAGADTEGVSPLSQVRYDEEETATLRPDVERAPLGNALAVTNAPQAGNGFFKVPKVIER